MRSPVPYSKNKNDFTDQFKCVEIKWKMQSQLFAQTYTLSQLAPSISSFLPLSCFFCLLRLERFYLIILLTLSEGWRTKGGDLAVKVQSAFLLLIIFMFIDALTNRANDVGNRLQASVEEVERLKKGKK